jgi:hypothetical protein
MAARYPNTPIFGHGQVNPGHKEPDEGLSARAAALAYRANTSRMDAQIGSPAVNATGNVNLTVNSNGTAARTSASADGLWQKTTIQNYKQMQKTEAVGAGASGGW